MGLSNKMKVLLITFVAVLVISLLMVAFKSLFIGQAYEAELDVTYNDTAGTVHTIEGSSFGGDEVAPLYGIIQVLVVIGGLIAMLAEAVLIKG